MVDVNMYVLRAFIFFAFIGSCCMGVAVMSVHIRNTAADDFRLQRQQRPRRNRKKRLPLDNGNRRYSEELEEDINKERIVRISHSKTDEESGGEDDYASNVRLPPIVNNSTNESSPVNDLTAPVQLSEADEVTLRHNLSVKLETVSKEILQSAHRALQLTDHRNSGVQTPQIIQEQLKRYHVVLSSEMINKLFSKFVSPRFPGSVEYNKLIGYLIQIKKLPILKIAQQNFGSYLKQEEIPILDELKRQFKENSTDVAMLYLHANEMDRAVRGVLTKSQVKKLLAKSGIRLTDNLLDSMLHYCDKDGYRLYSIDKLLDYFDRAVREDRSFLKNNRRPLRASRIPSPTPPSPLPVLQRSMSPVPVAPRLPQLPPPDNSQFEEIEPPFDQEEWLRRFNFMSRAIFNCHQDRQGFLSTDEVEHIVKTYNLVYNLDIPNSVISRCLSQAFDNNWYLIDINQFVQILQTLCLQLAKFN